MPIEMAPGFRVGGWVLDPPAYAIGYMTFAYLLPPCYKQ